MVHTFLEIPQILGTTHKTGVYQYLNIGLILQVNSYDKAFKHKSLYKNSVKYLS